MTRCVPQTYELSETEYKLFRGFFKIGYTASLIAGLKGLAGIVTGVALAAHFSGPENSQLTKELLNSSFPFIAWGTLGSLYFGLNYHLNRPLDKPKKQN